jgi:hypothetical protein
MVLHTPSHKQILKYLYIKYFLVLSPSEKLCSHLLSLAFLFWVFTFISFYFNLLIFPPFRVLVMMQTVASHKAENRMSSSAVAACMAPLLLRPLLAGDCEIENDFDVGGDGSAQLLQAAAAANHAQAIVITLLEEYDKIFKVSSNIFLIHNCM